MMCKGCHPLDEEVKPRDQRRLPAMDLYSGGGGTVIAASRFFDVKLAVDIDSAACRTLM